MIVMKQGDKMTEDDFRMEKITDLVDEVALDEADEAAEKDDKRISHEHIFRNIRKHLDVK